MSPRDDRARLLDIVAAARNIQDFVAGVDPESFRSDKKTQCAVQHQIMLIGEAAKLLSSEFRDRHIEIPWAPIARMRDKLIHGYADVDLDLIWKTAVESVPELLVDLESLLPGDEEKP